MSGSEEEDMAAHCSNGRAQLGAILKKMAEETEEGEQANATSSGGVRPKVFPVESVTNRNHAERERPRPRRLEQDEENRIPINNKMRMLRNITRSEDFMNDKRSTLNRVWYNYSGSSSENEDDCYVYMYKGKGSEEIPPIERLNLNNDDGVQQRCSSPDMDFLEMDFDPGLSNGHDYSDDSDCCDMEDIDSCPESNSKELDDFGAASSNSAKLPEIKNNDVPTLAILAKNASPREQRCNGHKGMKEVNNSSEVLKNGAGVNTNDSVVLNGNFSMGFDRNTTMKMPPSEVPPNDQVDLSKQLLIWDEDEAEKIQVVASSPATGAAAVVNTFIALNVEFERHAILQRLEPQDTTECSMHYDNLPKYLIKRSQQGPNHEDLKRVIESVSESVAVRFFSTYPPRRFGLCSWLLHWIGKGAIPIITLNTQRHPANESVLDDSWHHRMVRGADGRNIYLTDPVQCLSEQILLQRISISCVQVVDTVEIMFRWKHDTDLSELINQEDPAWKSLNVLGQIVNIIREEVHGHKPDGVQHVVIPTCVSPGITLVMTKNNPHLVELQTASELPLLSA